MSYRFTNTDKWNDAWFCDLKPLTKLLFLYLCDQCDVAGFLELNYRKIAFDLGIGKQEVESGMEGISGRIIFSDGGKYILIKNFIKHQKNLPLNPNNNAHKGIIERFESFSKLFEKQLDIKELISPLSAPNKPLSRGTGKGRGKGNGNSLVSNKGDEEGMGGEEENPNPQFDFSFVNDLFKDVFLDWLEYKKQRRESYKSQKSAEACCNKLYKLSQGKPETARKIVEQSMANNWAGLFPLSEQPQTQPERKLNPNCPKLSLPI